MMRYYFTDEEGNEVISNHIGNIRGARKKARQATKQFNSNIYINDCETENIVDVVFKED